MTPAISMSGVTKRYRSVTALGDLTLDVPAGSIFGFLGANGAGKTTALKILAGLTRATAGSAAVNGIAVDVQGTHRARIGYLAQDPQFYGWMTGRQTLEYVAGFFMPRATGGRIDELLDLVGIADAATRRTSTYSGGMRQRLGIAQALVGDPAVLLLDEPAAAIDPIGRHDVLRLMERLRGTTTIFYSTHILDDVERVSDQVAIVDRGRVVVSAPTTELMRRSAAPTVRVALVGASDATAVGANHPARGQRGRGGRAEWRRVDLRHHGRRRPDGGGAGRGHALRRRNRADRRRQPTGGARSRGRLPAHRQRGACSMIATGTVLQA
jgi:ABC-2 type transport system ATP-binding protein